jgi:hypothetical protein
VHGDSFAAAAYGVQTFAMALGVGAFVLACIAHFRSTAVRPPNLRMLLKKETETLHDHAAKLKKAIERSNRSGNSAAGSSQTDRSGGNMQPIADLIAKLPPGGEQFFQQSEAQMEAKLVELHFISLEISRLQVIFRESKSGPKHGAERAAPES